jgi:thymidylate synthase (FAD)
MEAIENHSSLSYALYQNLLTGQKGQLSRELARIILPVNFYTEWYWKIDLHNLLHFLHLRTDSHAQYEIRRYAEIVDQIVNRWVPYTYSAFQDYVRNAYTLSAMEVEAIKKMLAGQVVIKETVGMTEREWNEFSAKFISATVGGGFNK